MTAAKRAKAPSKAAATWPIVASEMHHEALFALAHQACNAPHLLVNIPGPPVAKGRPRAAIVAGRPRLYTPAETEAYETHVREVLTLECASQRWPIGGWKSPAVRYALHAEFVIARDVEDADNLVKAQLDAANKVLFPDDRRVCLMLIARRVVENGVPPGATLRVWALGPTEEP